MLALQRSEGQSWEGKRRASTPTSVQHVGISEAELVALGISSQPSGLGYPLYILEVLKINLQNKSSRLAHQNTMGIKLH